METTVRRDRGGQIAIGLIVVSLIMGTARVWWPYAATLSGVFAALFSWNPFSKETQDRLSWWMWTAIGAYFLIRFGDAIERIERRVERIEDLVEDMAEQVGVRPLR